MTDFPEHVLLVLRVRIQPADIPAQARFKRLLKALLCGYGCICTDIRPLAGPGGSASQSADGPQTDSSVRTLD